MENQENQYAFPGQRPAPIDKMDQSRFWQRLNELSNTEQSDERKRAVDHLKSSVRKVTDQAKWISAQVNRFMHQYTLHEERHFLNVLAIMDALVPDGVIGQLSALECALPILAAYTHDLGMALSDEEHAALFDESTEEGKHFASYRTRFDEELRQLERWRKVVAQAASLSDPEASQAQSRIDAIEGHILASYLRDTHTEDDQVRRLRRWLETIKKESGDENLYRDGVGGKDFQRELALIGISHGRGTPWLRRQLVGDDPNAQQDRFFQPVATGESANLAFPGLLLRLADVMDFDASRAPRILFKHFGIENDQSVLEWNKHLSIVGWRLYVNPDSKQQPDLLYSAECQHPVHEKAIREFKTSIDAELSAVRIELDAQRRQLPAADRPHYELHLPSQTRLDIRPVRDPVTDQPKYVYHDLQFRLDQDEIQQLLMGESLYGDPSLCIRELLQNALDALELRELRLKMKQKGETHEPVDGILHPTKKGWIINAKGEEEELRVTLDWGTDEETGQQWLRVTDNGVGMTKEVIKNYFTQIGKSFYRSPEFTQERAAMKAAGEVVSPISQFGIGILSSFMIGASLQVRTSTGLENHNVFISGAGSLFWITNGTLPNQGTELKITLKSGFETTFNERDLCDSLRYKFGIDSRLRSKANLPKRHVIDPPLLAALSFPWPHYPIACGTREILRIDKALQLHKVRNVHHLCGMKRGLVDLQALAQDSRREECTITWNCFDWCDADSPASSGTRIRFLFPVLNDRSCSQRLPVSESQHGWPFDELLQCVESSRNRNGRGRHLYNRRDLDLVTVNGVMVPITQPLRDELNRYVSSQAGTEVWIDLRGDLAFRLSVDRSRAYIPDDTWCMRLNEMFERLSQDLADLATTSTIRRNLLTGFLFKHRSSLTAKANSVEAPRTFDIVSWCRTAMMDCSPQQSLRFRASQLIESLKVDWSLSNSASRDELAPKFESYDSFDLDEEIEVDSVSVIQELAMRAIDRGAKRLNPKGTVPTLQQSLDEALGTPLNTLLDRTDCRMSSILQDAFCPSLERSWPVLDLFGYRGLIGQHQLSAPGIVELSDSLTPGAGLDPQINIGSIEQLGYDLTFPMTSIPLGALRRDLPEWCSNRDFRPLGVAPFLLGSLHDLWPAHAAFLQERFKVPHIYCLLPGFELWSKRFDDWTDADWHDPENLSALWDLSGQLTGKAGQVLWARGTHDIHDMPKIGLQAPEFLDAHR